MTDFNLNNNFDYKRVIETWRPEQILIDIPHGDMPGDKVEITEQHIFKANVIFPEMLRLLAPIMQTSPNNRAVITVCGGSGVGKSEIASILSYYLIRIGIGSYTLSGDNYPKRIPKYNDAERIRIFRQNGVDGLVSSGAATSEHYSILHKLQAENKDADVKFIYDYPWMESYRNAGRRGLESYLGTKNEIDFDEITSIVADFKNGSEKIWLKRMGRDETALWYDEVNFSGVNVLLIEWTHGNSNYYEGVDIPILLNSTPQETLVHRQARNRDGAVDSPFTMLVLEIEQEILKLQASKAKIILSKTGELLSYETYQQVMKEAEGNG